MGEGGGSSDAFSWKKAIDKSACNTERADSVMFIKRFVFCCDDAIDEVFWKLVKFNNRAFFISVKFMEKVCSCAVVNFGTLVNVAISKGVDVGEVFDGPKCEDSKECCSKNNSIFDKKPDSLTRKNSGEESGLIFVEFSLGTVVGLTRF